MAVALRVAEEIGKHQKHRTFLKHTYEPVGDIQRVWLVDASQEKQAHLSEMPEPSATRITGELLVNGSVIDYLVRVRQLAKGAGLDLKVKTHNPPFPPAYELEFRLRDFNIASRAANNNYALCQTGSVHDTAGIIYRVVGQSIALLDY